MSEGSGAFGSRPVLFFLTPSWSVLVRALIFPTPVQPRAMTTLTWFQFWVIRRPLDDATDNRVAPGGGAEEELPLRTLTRWLSGRQRHVVICAGWLSIDLFFCFFPNTKVTAPQKSRGGIQQPHADLGLAQEGTSTKKMPQRARPGLDSFLVTFALHGIVTVSVCSSRYQRQHCPLNPVIPHHLHLKSRIGHRLSRPVVITNTRKRTCLVISFGCFIAVPFHRATVAATVHRRPLHLAQPSVTVKPLSRQPLGPSRHHSYRAVNTCVSHLRLLWHWVIAPHLD